MRTFTKDYSFGTLYTSSNALSACEKLRLEQFSFILRHVNGDYGEIPFSQALRNEQHLISGLSVVSVYRLLNDQKIYVMTVRGHTGTYITLGKEKVRGMKWLPVRIPPEYLTEGTSEHTCRSKAG